MLISLPLATRFDIATTPGDINPFFLSGHQNNTPR